MAKSDQDFQRLLEEEQAEKTAQNKKLKAQSSKLTSQKAGFIGVSIAAIAILFAIVIYDPFTGSLRWGSGQEQTDVSSSDTAGDYQAPVWWKESANKYPVTLTQWQKDTFTEENRQKLFNEISTHYNGSAIDYAARTLPAESTGFTSDVTKELLEDGTLNPMFSYWTKELYIAEVGGMLERIINPTFGNWENDGYNGRLTQVSYSALEDLFSQRWLDSNPTSENMPLYVSSSDIEYLPEGGSRWIGVIDHITTNFAYDQSIRNYKATLEVDIVYTTWTQSREKITENAQIRLVLVPNQDIYSNGSKNHIVIDEAQLEVR